MAFSRRSVLTGGIAAVGGAAIGAGAEAAPDPFGPHRLPLEGGYAPAGNPLGWTARGHVRVIWHVPTPKPYVALTFDDGPMPDWTPRVLDTLDAHDATATFFLVGAHLRAHAGLIRGRYDRHEVGNHTWSHADLAQLDTKGVTAELTKCHDEIHSVLGRRPTLMRPPYGHVAGSTLVVADTLDYDVVLWACRMPENEYVKNPTGIVDRIVGEARPGAVLLAHDTGPVDRLVTIDNLAGIIAGLRAKGLTLVTVSELLASVTTVAT